MALKLIRSLTQNNLFQNGSVVTIGNFDGIHKGHQALLNQVNFHANRLNLPSVLLTFEPYPAEYFRPHDPFVRLTSLTEKIIFLKQSDLNYLLPLRFNRQLSEYQADYFIKHILVKNLNTKFLIVGEDFHFGHRREGNIDTLEKASKEYNFELAIVSNVLDNHERISSTQIRKALTQADFKLAEQQLGRPFSISSRVVHGDKRGRELGYPTLNMRLHRRIIPFTGIYIVEAFHHLTHKIMPGVASIGVRPMFNLPQGILETYLLEDSGNYYGDRFTIYFKQKIRDEQKFDSLEQLRLAMAKDVAIAKAFFNS